MKFLIRDKHINFFKENGYIEFSDFLSDVEKTTLFNEVKNTISKRSNKNIEDLSSIDIYKNSRDLFRDSIFLKKFELDKNISQTACSLTHKNFLQLSFDQALFKDISSFFKINCSFNEIFCFKGLEIIVLLNLSDTHLDIKDNFLSISSNSILFINPGKVLDFEIFFNKSINYFLIGYARLNNLMYIENKEDINQNLLKKMGYCFGDNLKNNNFPIVK
jgi:hypothetical protein